jgi:hypothetical protein
VITLYRYTDASRLPYILRLEDDCDHRVLHCKGWRPTLVEAAAVERQRHVVEIQSAIWAVRIRLQDAEDHKAEVVRAREQLDLFEYHVSQYGLPDSERTPHVWAAPVEEVYLPTRGPGFDPDR